MSGTLICDLDGVVYLGETATPGAADAVRRAETAGWRVLFATNNSSRRPSHVVEKLARVTGYSAQENQIVTSSLAAASLIETGPVLVMGEEGIVAAVTEAGFELTDDPVMAATVVAGLDRTLSYQRITAAAEAVRNGARLIVTNRDSTFPTDVGLLPGAGACVAPLEVATGVVGVTAGKPSPAMRRFIETRSGPGPIVIIGDRPDTDLALARRPRWRTILVLTGVTADPATADPQPDMVADHLAGAIEALLMTKGSDLVS